MDAGHAETVANRPDRSHRPQPTAGKSVWHMNPSEPQSEPVPDPDRSPDQAKALLKILIGAAWIDGEVQPAERQHLQQVAIAQGLATDPDLQPLLTESVPVTPAQCYAWIQDYLGDHPTAAASQRLLEAVSALVYSDGEMAVAEARLISRLQQFDPDHTAGDIRRDRRLDSIRQLYRHWRGQWAD